MCWRAVPAGGAEGLDGIELALLHQSVLPPFYNRNGLAGVDVVAVDGVPVEVGDALHLVPVQRDS